ncbi:(2Fe-2S) ferredoxin domain-containing protein [Micromonospora sp. KC213]|uniref:(2Fe-2S) ferredoxin domain-containing protein n=1 Tax=Micromonospora sp. KC213 TaxID=2530378 RepID=UPI00104C9297|nr:(2Fe-2S) ferredoxin domain-containing protein [Micromonospora sp. KC213]TDC38635.1 (2Fe-2S) ferredoxin domain-containing protein [Micromonospora sp. KC213]
MTVAYCDGHRCRALRGRSPLDAPDGEREDLTERLRRAVRASHGGVLVRAECLGACHRAPALLLLTGADPAGRRGMLIGPVEESPHIDAVVDLIRKADSPGP